VAVVLLHITPRKSGFLASCEQPPIHALGASAVLAAENALLAARAMLGRNFPPKVIVHVSDRDSTSVVMQNSSVPIDLNRALRSPDRAEFVKFLVRVGEGRPNRAGDPIGKTSVEGRLRTRSLPRYVPVVTSSEASGEAEGDFRGPDGRPRP
jgi:hypothetical protein